MCTFHGKVAIEQTVEQFSRALKKTSLDYLFESQFEYQRKEAASSQTKY